MNNKFPFMKTIHNHCSNLSSCRYGYARTEKMKKYFNRRVEGLVCFPGRDSIVFTKTIHKQILLEFQTQIKVSVRSADL